MRKTTRKQTDKLFEGMAHDLYSKFEENVTTIYDHLFTSSNVADILDRRQLIRNRLLIEFGYVRAIQGNKEVKNATKKTKKDNKKKKSTRTSTKKLVSTKKT